MNCNMDDDQPAPILTVSHLNIFYGAFQAVRDVSFEVNREEIFGILGPNGAGKTSTLGAIEGLLRPGSGVITVAGYDIGKAPMEARAHMGVQLQATSFQPELTVSEILRLYAGLYGAPMDASSIRSGLTEIGLGHAAEKRFGQLSGGQQQRVSLMISTLHHPQLLLLDEPTTGLDPQSRRQLWERMEAIREKGNAVILTTHSMEEAEAVCDRVAIIDHGRVIAVDSPATLIERHRHDPDVIRASRKGKVTLEDVFIGLTGATVRA